MDYSRPILVSNWHKNREAEPKDYDVTAHPTGEKDLHQSTYKHFANALDYSWDTTTKDLQSQFHLKKYYKVKETPKPMLNADNFHMANFNRDMTTTYSIEYQSPYYCRTPPVCPFERKKGRTCGRCDSGPRHSRGGKSQTSKERKKTGLAGKTVGRPHQYCFSSLRERRE
ncbi:UNVERIFIED_CONTAM: hypothetical protein FKN15_059384 [Acipenser sinensis]